MRLYHGTHHEDLPTHIGVCFTPDFRSASEYARVHSGEWVHEVSVDLSSLIVEEIEVDVQTCRNVDHWPGDTATECAALAARGVDIIVFDDVCHTMCHRTYRMVSERALAALTYEGGYDP